MRVTSSDMKTWTVVDPLWAPEEYYTHECPDCFKMGDWWYLVYSTFTERMVTHYRKSRNLNGPWLAPANDAFDARGYYAAKTAADDKHRYIFGWLPSRDNDSDEGGWNWGGNLVVHEVTQNMDGSLSVNIPEPVKDAFTKEAALAEPKPVLGSWDIKSGKISADATGRHSILEIDKLPEECLLECSISVGPETYGCGLMLRADKALDKYYVIRIESGNNRVVIDRWPRPADQAFQVERPLKITPGKIIDLKVIIDGNCLVIYADNEVAACFRMYDLKEGSLCLFTTEGTAEFTSLSVKTR